LIRSFLEKLGVSEDTAEKDACALEHLVSEETVERIKKFMQ
jgi:Mn-dependent DtxR family transcriptional regulator